MLGTGDIGQEVCRRLRAFAPSFIKGVNLHGNNPGNLFDQVQTPEKLASLLTDTDILIISLPGTKETFHLISTPQLSRLPDHAAIINVGRGTVVDQEALEEEPLPAESVLWDSPRAVITPHVAGDTSLPHIVDRIVDLFLEETVHTRSPTFLNYLNALLFNTLYQKKSISRKKHLHDFNFIVSLQMENGGKVWFRTRLPPSMSYNKHR